MPGRGKATLAARGFSAASGRSLDRLETSPVDSRQFFVGPAAAAGTGELGEAALEPAAGEDVERLPDGYRAVVLLRDLEGLSNEEVAEVLGETVASVKSRLHRARMAPREQLTRALV